ncbi:TRAP transporter large permease subunit [Pseudooceanicola sp. MF1-13]|uniref:TRAP transporter large permease subunit n=1 Tax=Pseudooceanicola sp. MF1-13 TaxID=3379095 RepID=UPI0038913916
MSLAAYALVIVLWVRRSPDIAPIPDETFTLKQKMRALGSAWPAGLLFTLVLGGIYGGFFTATEAAALSLLFATLLGVLRGRIAWKEIVPMIRETMISTSAIFLIAACAKIFVSLIALTGLSSSLGSPAGDRRCQRLGLHRDGLCAVPGAWDVP